MLFLSTYHTFTVQFSCWYFLARMILLFYFMLQVHNCQKYQQSLIQLKQLTDPIESHSFFPIHRNLCIFETCLE